MPAAIRDRLKDMGLAELVAAVVHQVARIVMPVASALRREDGSFASSC